MSGVFAIARSAFDHPFFKPEPFTEREAWFWLCGAAAFKPTRVRPGRRMVELDRGQCAFAHRFLAVKWKWSDARVRRFLKRLETDAMVTLQPTRNTTLITICNYDKYAFGRRTDDATAEPHADALATHSRRKEEELNNDKKEELSLSEPSSDAQPSKPNPKKKNAYPVEFESFWKAYPTDALMSKKQAFDAWKRLSPDDRDLAARAVPGFRRHCEKNPDYRPVHACRFITHRRFDGFATPGASNGPPAGLSPEEQARWVRQQMEAERAPQPA